MQFRSLAALSIASTLVACASRSGNTRESDASGPTPGAGAAPESAGGSTSLPGDEIDGSAPGEEAGSKPQAPAATGSTQQPGSGGSSPGEDSGASPTGVDPPAGGSAGQSAGQAPVATPSVEDASTPSGGQGSEPAATDAAARRTIEIYVTEAGVAIPDVAVMYADAAGVHLQTLRTDAEGHVVFDQVPEGGSVTVARFREDTWVDLLTYGAVPFGSVLRVEAPVPSSEIVGTVNATYSNTTREPVYLLGQDRSLHEGAVGELSADVPFHWLSPDGTLDLLAVAGYDDPDSEYQVREGLVSAGQAPDLIFATEFDTWTTPVTINATFDHDYGGATGTVNAYIRALRHGSIHDLGGGSYVPTSQMEYTATSFAYPPFTDQVQLFYHVPTFQGDATRAHTFPSVPAPGGTLEFQQATSDLFPDLSSPVLDFDAFTFDSGWSSLPSCAGAEPKAIHLTLRSHPSALPDGSSWELWGPYAQPFEAPELDPEVVGDRWPGQPFYWEWEAHVIGLSNASYDDMLSVLPSDWEIGLLAEDVCYANASDLYFPDDPAAN